MPDKETIFFSYNRKDSEIALKLADDLTASGLNVWIDQRNITPGTRWDDEIEHSLAVSGTQLVILSPTSVESQNVLDEVSYAIDSGKRIIPILIEQCHIPLRLSRFQYIDFTIGYEKGLKNLHAVLNGKPQDANVNQKHTLEAKDGAKSGNTKSRKPLIIAASVAVLLILVFALTRGGSENVSESTSEGNTTEPSEETQTQATAAITGENVSSVKCFDAENGTWIFRQKTPSKWEEQDAAGNLWYFTVEEYDDTSITLLNVNGSHKVKLDLYNERVDYFNLENETMNEHWLTIIDNNYQE